ncbi:hypothetical protein DICPUDRAFT_154197 [Dictyostelium purpureum]|uniref:tRNA-5-taurinomethyluridine 2-sulfurtransferase n=1 Tax=Dictyostelium purpureum TaxID=5786 RepID=F0ZQQ3_DICPU|nr:uncharacterized protein DICPUDRAFT_154197 [Dictyostelium purpureum]EGC33720.1 hypothetical protein DICPUDRAFT_154197 [Dictyostelium purpureum]|eukprot:XP_003289759.1 hypothetical protein DICPUDRAFT_154197 [Dictyostelium purpureum]
MLLNKLKRLNIIKRNYSTSATDIKLNKEVFPSYDVKEFENILKNTPIRFPSMDLIPTKPKVAVGMSGGVDSTITAKILKHQGFDVTGVFIKSWDDIEESGRCQGERDYKDAIAVAKYLDIPMYQADFVKDYWNRVFTGFLKDYQSGITPNPDVWCNREIKFDLFIDFAKENFGVDYIATGHYSNLYYDKNDPNKIELYRSVDKSKDQTYFLCMTKTKGLANSIFPIGDFTKDKIIDFAKTIPDFTNVLSKKSSRGICFIGKKSLPDFLSQYIDLKPGFYYDISKGFIIPHQKHQGSICYTIGQKAKIHSSSEKYYVVSTDIKKNIVNVCPESLVSKYLNFSQFQIHGLNWINEIPKEVFSEEGFKARGQYKHRGEIVELIMKRTDDLYNNSNVYNIQITSEPIRNLASGQILCLFDKDTDKCYGGDSK